MIRIEHTSHENRQPLNLFYMAFLSGMAFGIFAVVFSFLIN